MSVERVDPSDEKAIATYNSMVQAAWQVDVGVRPCPFPAGEIAAEGLAETGENIVEYYLLYADGTPRGVARMKFSENDAPQVMSGFLTIHPGARGKGYGTILLGAVEQRTVERERSIAILRHWFSNSALADTAGAVFAARHGYELGQHSEARVHSVPLDQEHLRRANLALQLDPNYDLVLWEDACPDEIVDGMATLRETFLQEAPSGNLPPVHQRYDRTRIRDEEERHRKIGETHVGAGVVHKTSGELVGYTVIDVPTTDDVECYQGVTLVRPDHRRHGLGLRLKLANITRLEESRPTARRVVTMNAADNAAMIALNNVIGMKLLDQSAAWVKILT
ncbi:MAG TPA: GNAT family N-acetyltransferase [Acidimicrobiales bacterium]|nr:GNAT family N-acetyltransferase [Acidimicrobiales bacterium]